MLTTLLALLSSSGIGSILGLFGGLLNRKIDIAAKKAEYDFEIKKLNAQKEYLELEYKARTETATIEATGAIETAAYGALADSYNYARTSKEDGWIDGFSKIVRPFLTLAFFALTVYIFYVVHGLVQTAGNVFEPKELLVIYKDILTWVFFQAGVSIGWWFANRSSGSPKFGRGK